MFTPNLIIGLAIMTIGVLLILERLGLANAMELLEFWPVVLVLFGASVAAQSLRRRDPSVPPQKPVIGPGFVLLVLVVAMFATSGFQAWGVDTESSDAERVNLFGVMGSGRRTVTSTDFKSARIGSVMGRSTLDLREAKIGPGEEAVVDVFVAMGRATIRIPNGWTLDTSALPVMGSVDDERWPREPPPVEPGAPVEASAPATGPPPRLVLRGFVMMGKVEIQS